MAGWDAIAKLLRLSVLITAGLVALQTLGFSISGVLAFGALGGIVAMLWPFFPGLLKVAPLAAVLAVVAWLMVAGRLRNSGLEEFVEALQATAETDDGESTPAA